MFSCSVSQAGTPGGHEWNKVNAPVFIYATYLVNYAGPAKQDLYHFQIT